MSKISIAGASTGTATFTIESPATSTNRTLTLPDNTGTIITQNSTPAFASTIGVGGATPSTSGAGITFPATQSASSDANTLDDYEEGTWTPSVGGTATYDGLTYGRYTKIGNVVTCQFRIAITLIGTGSTTTISGLPFTSPNLGTVQSGHCSYYESLAVNTIYLALYVENNATTAVFVGQASSGATVANGIGLFGNGTAVFGQVTYRAA